MNTKINKYDTNAIKNISIKDIAKHFYPSVEIKDNRCKAVWRSGDNSNSVAFDSSKNLYYDHVAKVGGSAIDFLMNAKGLKEFEAIEEIAKTFNLKPIDEPEKIPRYEVLKKYYNKTNDYIYSDEHGKPIHKTVRYELKKEFKSSGHNNKDFQQYQYINGHWKSGLKDIERVPYNLPEVIKSKLVIINEGEKCAELTVNLGLTGTCFCCGSNGYKPHYAEWFKGKDVVIIADNHKEGMDFAEKTAKGIHETVSSVKVITVTEQSKGDIEQFIEEGGTKEKLLKLIEDAPQWKPETATVKSSVDLRNRGLKLIHKNGKNRLMSELARDVIEELSKSNEIFRYGTDVVKVTDIQRRDKNNDIQYFTGVNHLTPSRFITASEKYIEPVKETQNDTYASSFNESEARQILNSDEVYKLPELVSTSKIKLPYIKNNNLKFTDKGYNSDTGIFTCSSALNSDFIELDEGIEFLREMFKDTCFLEWDLDFSRMLAYMLTPLIKLLINSTKSQVFNISGNREGVGKDYLLGIPILIYEDRKPFFYAPCNSDDEYKKVFFSACRENERFLLFSNMKGHLNSKAFEHYCTSPIIKDRILGESTTGEFLNQSIVGISENGLTVTPDMERRILRIRLEYYDEDIKQRKFKRDLHTHITENRQKILNILYSLSKNWFMNGKPLGEKIPSFEKWSSTASGIITSAGLQSPFDKRTVFTASMNQSGDKETLEFKRLFEAWYEKYQGIAVKSRDIIELANEYGLFNYLDLESQSGKVRLSKKLNERDKRIYSDLQLNVLSDSKYKSYYIKPNENFFVRGYDMPNMPEMPTKTIKNGGIYGISGISNSPTKKFSDKKHQKTEILPTHNNFIQGIQDIEQQNNNYSLSELINSYAERTGRCIEKSKMTHEAFCNNCKTYSPIIWIDGNLCCIKCDNCIDKTTSRKIETA